MIEVVVKAKNPARFTIKHQGGIGSHLPVWKLGNEINFRPVIAIICTPLEGNVYVAGVLKIPGGISTGINYCEQVTVFCGDDCGDSKILGSSIFLGKNYLSKRVCNKGVIEFALRN